VSLRTRLTLTILGVLTATVAAVLAVTDVAFAAQQQREQGEQLLRELERVATVVAAGEVGANLVTGSQATLRLQFVTSNGRVVIPAGEQAPLPLAGEPELLRDAPDLPGRWLVASTPWRLGSGVQAGTLRGAASLAGLDAARTNLRITLLAIGAAALVSAAALAILALRRSLAPLTDLARQASHVDPGDPRFATYRGPDDEVGEVARALNTVLDAIRARRSAERERLADVAHELAAPLTVVNAHLDELADRWQDAEDVAGSDVQRLRAAQAAADDLLYVSQDLLTLARGDLGERMHWEIVDLRDVAVEMQAAHPGMTVRVGGVREATATDGESSERSGISEVDDERESAVDVRVVADGARVRQILRNLIRNAERAAGSDDGVALHVVPLGPSGAPDRVAIRVEDEGPGLSDEQREEIFERYHTRTGGTGLGLAVVQRLVERLGGEVSARARDGGTGATFEVVLPSFLASLAQEDDELGDRESDERATDA